jgi:hypothetical protein
MDQEEMVSLCSLAMGACIERFDDELEKVVTNILDPNTDSGTREINLKVKIIPNEERNFCAVRVQCSSRMAAPKSFETHIYIGRDIKGVKITEYHPDQMKLNLKDKNEKVTLIKSGGEK